MRIYHHDLIPCLPSPLLRALHRDLANLRGRGWGKRSPALRHLSQGTIQHLLQYHTTVLREMIRRGWRPCSRWFEGVYRGRSLEPFAAQWVGWDGSGPLYPEHTEAYLRQGVAFLEGKLADLDFPLGETERALRAAQLRALMVRRKGPRARVGK